MRLIVPLVEGLGIKTHLCKLIANYATHLSHKLGEPVTIIRGSKVREVTEARLLAERKIMEEGDLSKPAQVDAALRALSAKSLGKMIGKGRYDQGLHTHEVRDIMANVAQLLTVLDKNEGASEWEETKRVTCRGPPLWWKNMCPSLPHSA